MSNDLHDDHKHSYAIGYGKRPAAHRFEPGRSGNPEGRPRKATSFAAAFNQMLNSSTTTVLNGKRRRKTMIEIAVMRAMKDIATGNPRALERWIPIIERYAPASTYDSHTPTPDLSSMTDEQLRAIASIKMR